MWYVYALITDGIGESQGRVWRTGFVGGTIDQAVEYAEWCNRNGGLRHRYFPVHVDEMPLYADRLRCS